MNNLKEAQEKLYQWLACFEKKSYLSIRQNCDYLNIQYGLGIENYAIWQIFYPLVYSGVIDYVGNGYFALTEQQIIDLKTHYVISNPFEKENIYPTEITGIFRAEKSNYIPQSKVVGFNALNILSRYPSIKSIVDGFYESIVDEDKFEYHNFKTKKGVAELKDGGLVRYFSDPGNSYQRQIPDKSVNPDALNIAYCYERVINQQDNGLYSKSSKVLKLQSFGLPFMIYRVLMLEMLSKNCYPSKYKNEVIFKNIEPRLVKELNKIFCNTIAINE